MIIYGKGNLFFFASNLLKVTVNLLLHIATSLRNDSDSWALIRALNTQSVFKIIYIALSLVISESSYFVIKLSHFHRNWSVFMLTTIVQP